jgi:hypothetical protein
MDNKTNISKSKKQIDSSITYVGPQRMVNNQAGHSNEDVIAKFVNDETDTPAAVGRTEKGATDGDGRTEEDQVVGTAVTNKVEVDADGANGEGKVDSDSVDGEVAVAAVTNRVEEVGADGTSIHTQIKQEIVNYEDRLINKKIFINNLKKIITDILNSNDGNDNNDNRNSLITLLNTENDDVPKDFKNYIIGEIMIVLKNQGMILLGIDSHEINDYIKYYESVNTKFNIIDFNIRSNKGILKLIAAEINRILLVS